MTLVPSTLSSPLTKIYLDIKLESDGIVKAGQIADAIDAYAKTAIPMVMHKSGQTRTVANMTTWVIAPGRVVDAAAEGGLDSSATGIGLGAAKETLKADLKTIFSTVDGTMTAQKSAQMMTDAFTKFIKSAKVMTTIKAVTLGGAAAPMVTTPPPNNATLPIDAYQGTGSGSLDSSAAGPGLNKEVDLATVMRDMLQNLDSMPKDYDDAAQKWADMFHTYLLKANIVTTNDQGTVTGGKASVVPFVPGTPPIIGGNGVSTTPSKVQVGSGSGTMT